MTQRRSVVVAPRVDWLYSSLPAPSPPPPPENHWTDLRGETTPEEALKKKRSESGSAPLLFQCGMFLHWLQVVQSLVSFQS